MKVSVRSLATAILATTLGAAASAPSVGQADDVPSAAEQWELQPLFRSLSAQWWQLVWSVPPADNPVQDATGAKCAVGNRGRVWFLFGNSGGSTSRVCTLPEGKFLFFPVANSFLLNTPNTCGQGPAIGVRDERAKVALDIDAATGLRVELDGKRINHLIRRVRSIVFEGTFPADNIYAQVCASLGGFPGGVYSPGVDDGYYVLLDPPSVGTHLLRFQGTLPTITTSYDVTYTLNVKPVVLR